eukprot:TRINITY_DN340_c1_g1_i3.p1 TRINITY_DN340_c1_g1~~TRINITY_DN340_c1_g1_i3.p1  ORF type:complete len:294 (+),score=37.55 TRINITY_DN340_c1_g1_i3:298-1179(+)
MLPLQQHKKKVNEEDVVCWVPDSQVRRRVRVLLEVFDSEEEKRTGYYERSYWFCHYLPFPSRIQSGFNCGLVCLFMGADYFNSKYMKISQGPEHMKVGSLLDMAISLNYTAQGEIFSAYDLADLAERFFHLETKVIDGFSLEDIINHLLLGFPILFPYDCDQSYGPGMNGGKRAHWCTITGFVFRLKGGKTSSLYDSGDFSVDEENKNIVYSKIPPISTLTPLPFPYPPDDHIYLIAQQPKFRNVMVWPYKSVLESNLNLLNPSLERKSSGKFIIPETLDNLRGKIVLLFPCK